MDDAQSTIVTSKVEAEKIGSMSVLGTNRFPKIHLAKPKTPNMYYPPDFPVQMGKAVLTPRRSAVSKVSVRCLQSVKVSKPSPLWKVDLDRGSLYNNDPKKHQIPIRRRSTLPQLPKIQLNPNEPHDVNTPSPGPINSQIFIQTMNKPTKLAKALNMLTEKEKKKDGALSPISASVAQLRDRRVSVFDVPAPFQAKRCRRATNLGNHYCEILGPTSCSYCIERTNKDTADKIQVANLAKPPEVTSKSLVAPFLSFKLTKNMFQERLRTAEQVKYVEHLQGKHYNTPKLNRMQKLRLINVTSPERRFTSVRRDSTDTWSSGSVDESILNMSPQLQRKGLRRDSRVSFDFRPPTEFRYVPWD